jgi:hypothetical protein
MNNVELWRAKVADLKKFVKGSLKQLKKDQDNLLTLLEEYEVVLARVQSSGAGKEVMQQIAIVRYKPGRQDVVWRKRTRPDDFRKNLAGQRKRIPLYRGAIRRSEQNGILLSTCMKRLTEAESILR